MSLHDPYLKVFDLHRVQQPHIAHSLHLEYLLYEVRRRRNDYVLGGAWLRIAQRSGAFDLPTDKRFNSAIDVCLSACWFTNIDVVGIEASSYTSVYARIGARG